MEKSANRNLRRVISWQLVSNVFGQDTQIESKLVPLSFTKAFAASVDLVVEFDQWASLLSGGFWFRDGRG